jgi:heterodisulfide reductase subunit A
MTTGVFICKCGGNISSTVDCEKVRDSVKAEGDVKTAQVTEFLCSKPGLQLIQNSIKNHGLDRVVVACCSPHMHEEMFRGVVEEAGVNRHRLVHVNLREQCSWVHDRGATEKAVSLVRGGVARARTLEPLKEKVVKINRDVLVIGGGVAGITAALQLSKGGFKVSLVERRPSIGGRMAQLSKTFPTLDCSPCILSPRMAEVGNDENITLLTGAEVASVSGGPGDYHVKVRVAPRGVDVDKCLKCGQCCQVCPTEVPNEFEEKLYKRKAAYLPFPQAVPSSYAIDFEHCRRCGACVEACPVGAINLDDEEKIVTIDAGSMIVATGFDLIGNEVLRTYHPEMSGVVNALQVERLIENELTEGKVLTRGNGDRVKSIAYVLCAGSRDLHHGVGYCSGVCCAYSVKQAILLRKFLPFLKVYIYYTDMRMTGRGFENFYMEAREKGVQFIHAKPGGVTPLDDGRFEIIVEDLDTGLMLRNPVDLVVLSSAMVPSAGTGELASRLGIALGEDLFVAPKHVKLDPISTLREGVFAVGVATGTKDIHDSVIDARAAASHVYNFVGDGTAKLSPTKPVHQGECDLCGACVGACARGALTMGVEGPVLDPMSCNGCGACIPVCSKGSLRIPNNSREALLEEARGLLSGTEGDVVVLGFFDDNISYTAADNAGTARLHYPTNIRILRMPSTALLSKETILKAMGLGADGVLICEVDESHEAELAARLVTEVAETLKGIGVEPGRVRLQPMVLPIFKMLPKFVSDFTEQVKKMGKLSLEKRRLLLG